MSWKEDSANKDNWQKSNTEKAQTLSKVNKFAEKFNKDDEFKEHIKDYFYQDPSEFDKLGLSDKMEILEDPEVNTPSAIEQRLEVLESIESDRIQESRENYLEDTLDKLENANPDL